MVRIQSSSSVSFHHVTEILKTNLLVSMLMTDDQPRSNLTLGDLELHYQGASPFQLVVMIYDEELEVFLRRRKFSKLISMTKSDLG